jgi:hypothetical protein
MFEQLQTEQNNRTNISSMSVFNDLSKVQAGVKDFVKRVELIPQLNSAKRKYKEAKQKKDAALLESAKTELQKQLERNKRAIQRAEESKRTLVAESNIERRDLNNSTKEYEELVKKLRNNSMTHEEFAIYKQMDERHRTFNTLMKEGNTFANVLSMAKEHVDEIEALF